MARGRAAARRAVPGPGLADPRRPQRGRRGPKPGARRLARTRPAGSGPGRAARAARGARRGGTRRGPGERIGARRRPRPGAGGASPRQLPDHARGDAARRCGAGERMAADPRLPPGDPVHTPRHRRYRRARPAQQGEIEPRGGRDRGPQGPPRRLPGADAERSSQRPIRQASAASAPRGRERWRSRRATGRCSRPSTRSSGAASAGPRLRALESAGEGDSGCRRHRGDPGRDSTASPRPPSAPRSRPGAPAS